MLSMMAKRERERQVIDIQNYSFLLFLHTEIFNADIVIREDITVDQFIDVILGNRRYIKCIYVSIWLLARGLIGKTRGDYFA